MFDNLDARIGAEGSLLSAVISTKFGTRRLLCRRACGDSDGIVHGTACVGVLTGQNCGV
jgi:hypothetical protein